MTQTSMTVGHLNKSRVSSVNNFRFSPARLIRDMNDAPRVGDNSSLSDVAHPEVSDVLADSEYEKNAV